MGKDARMARIKRNAVYIMFVHSRKNLIWQGMHDRSESCFKVLICNNQLGREEICTNKHIRKRESRVSRT